MLELGFIGFQSVGVPPTNWSQGIRGVPSTLTHLVCIIIKKNCLYLMVVGAVFTDGIILVLPCVLELGSIGHQSVGVPPTNWGRRKAKDRASKADVSAGDRVRYKGRWLHLGQTCQLFQLESRKSAILQSENKKKNFRLHTQSCIKRPFCSTYRFENTICSLFWPPKNNNLKPATEAVTRAAGSTWGRHASSSNLRAERVRFSSLRIKRRISV